MQRLLKDHLVEHQDGETVFFTRTCTVCGAVWRTAARREMGRELAAAEAGGTTRMCHFCGRPVCGKCFTDVEGIALCVLCAARLRERMDVV